MDLSLSLRPAADAVLGALRSAGFRTPDLHEILVEIGDGVVQTTPPRIRPTVRAVVRVPPAVPKLIALARTRPEQWREQYAATVMPLVERIEGEDLTAWPDRGILDQIDELRSAQGRLTPPRFGCVVPRALLADQIMQALLRAAVGPGRADRLHIDMMAAIPCLTRDARTDLDRIAAMIHHSPQLRQVYAEAEPGDVPNRLRRFAAGRALLAEADTHLRRYGQRQMSVPLAGFPPLRETPEVLHGLLGGLSRGVRDDAPPADDDDRIARARTELAAERGVRAWVLGRTALRLLATARSGVAVREDSHFLLFMVVGAALRRLVLELGRRLAERGLLDDAADVFYLELEELDGLTPQRAKDVVNRRRNAREAAVDTYTMFPAELLGGNSTADAVRGTPASRGTAVGRVRVIRGEGEFGKLTAGEILVCPYTNPAWTPLFTLAAAVVTDAGGTASHAAIVAREHGIPAVMGTGNGTRLLADGGWVRVDGERGVVVPAEDAPLAGRTPDLAGADTTP